MSQVHSPITCDLRLATCDLTLYWQPTARPSADYTVFIQLWQNGELTAGFDSPPLNNDYPTSLWQAGEVIIDPHSLDLSTVPPGNYEILAGLYDFATGERLPATSQDTALPNYAVNLAVLQVE